MTIVKSTTEIGDDFRDRIADLLERNGFEVKREVLLDHMKVDIVATVQSLGRSRVIAVEAKNYSRTISKSDISGILASHLSLLTEGKIDEVLVVSNKENLSAATQAFLRTTNQINHLTIEELYRSLMDFRPFLRKVIEEHESGGLESYYVPQASDINEDTGRGLLEWVNLESNEPKAIVASYGMGKTSLAKHLNYVLAKTFLTENRGRIPILVKLGAISQEQSLDGLIGKTLAGSNHSVKNYNFPLFDEMNKKGHFVIFLDGFDEMKHMMSADDFFRNFEHLNRLSSGKSKVILLGRPSAFMSDKEKIQLLRGRRQYGKVTLKVPEEVHYHEIILTPFDSKKINTFVRGYIEHSLQQQSDTLENPLIEKRLKEVASMSDNQLLSRPVHTKMFVDVAVNSDTDLSNLSRYDLYNYFIESLLDREASKAGRGSVLKSVDRRLFACDLAWFLWTQSEYDGARIEDIPDSIFDPYIPRDLDRLTVKRDLISASFLDVKESDTFYFSHRSFLEFLVAERIWNDMTRNDESGLIFEVVNGALTDEVMDFLTERNDPEFFHTMSLLIGKSKCSFDLSLWDTLFKYQGFREIVGTTRYHQEFNLISSIYFFIQDYSENRDVSIKQLTTFLRSFLSQGKTEKSELALITLFYVIVFSFRNTQANISKNELASIIVLIFTLGLKESSFKASNNFRSEGPLDDIFKDAILFEFRENKMLKVTFNLYEILRTSFDVLGNNLNDFDPIHWESVMLGDQMADKLVTHLNESQKKLFMSYGLKMAKNVGTMRAAQ